MFLRLLLLFTLVPLIELYLLIKVGTIIGPLPTIALVVGTGFIGAYFVKRQGLSVLRRLRDEVARRGFPADQLIEGILLLVAGAFLIAPGLLTDAAGFLLLVPAVRRYARNRIKKRFADYFNRRRWG